MELRFRQIHLDFHTCEHLPDIGNNFDAEEFADTLQAAGVDSITCFARCHHGWLYYPSKRYPEKIHPQLKNQNLLSEMIEACHRRGIRVPIYITVQWDEQIRREHADWRVMDANGKVGDGPYTDSFYQDLCVNSPYRDYLKDITDEILQTMPVDGLFFDIVSPRDCSCRYCLEAMAQQGIDAYDPAQRQAFAQQTIDAFKLDMSAFIRHQNKDCSIFYNGSHINPSIRSSLSAYTHFELESLPSGSWGYLHFPLVMRYARTLGLDCLAHTGKFHTEWGDFHSFKNREALEYECFHMLALGAKCLIGDQLEPCGKLSQPVYDLIGSVYHQVQQKEPWCSGANAVTEIGVLAPCGFYSGSHLHLPDSLLGTIKMLEDRSYQFDILDECSDFQSYKVLILPDEVAIDSTLEEKLNRYTAQGGAVLVSFESGLSADGKSMRFVPAQPLPQQTTDLDGNPVRGKFYVSNNYADYLIPKGDIGKGLPETEHVMYAKGLEVQAAAGSDVLLSAVTSYFNRNWRRFCSHRQTPSSGKISYDAVIRRDNVIYFAHPIFKIYNERGAKWCKTLVYNALDMLLSRPLVSHGGPTTLHLYLNQQSDKSRYVLHALHYIPLHKSTIDIIEDIIDLYQIPIEVAVSEKIKQVTCVPDGTLLSFEQVNGILRFTLPKLHGHEMLEIAYE